MSNHVTVYTEDYRRAAEILIDHIDASCWDQDLLVYPVLILYRYNLALLIEQVICIAM